MATIATTLTKINLVGFSPPRSSSSRSSFSSARCSPIQQVQVDSTIECEPCNGKGWIVCDFCEGQKTNVKAENNRIYRRCPSCRAVGYVLCSKCKVFKCVTFPNFNDGADLSF
ncbi:uncharacterized protein LOC103488212 isoform X1 [Cucumis melo]|uniref:Uncharacterized protein LOC103488212 isoform X1 n=1 Tax=Cucumis melo TaxID=3656 RepID=A0A1S3BCN0_CUCME|nr:uncharacterized protein LOC103488212 isoform X1 [Cucumis melo]XP_016899914.1 uncharacterized protein LOC103488212 isoform X1 [Cucumis melo]XP_050938198.1 uncharacterized protein LOC103488212 isoform X1 [Cucumis melo]XP_050938199.1 uncharacterized protein LOC103488212 isoform X1 [Cucumis melo]